MFNIFKVTNCEFIQDFEVNRKDRATGCGGFLVAVKKDTTNQEITMNTINPSEIV